MAEPVDASTFDLAAYRADLEANEAADPVKRVSLWFLNAMSHHDPLAQAYRVLKNKAGTCNIVFVFTDKKTGRQITSQLNIEVDAGVPVATNFIYPANTEQLVSDVPIGNISADLYNGNIESIAETIKQIVLPEPEAPPAGDNAILNFDGDSLTGFDDFLIVGFDM